MPSSAPTVLKSRVRRLILGEVLFLLAVSAAVAFQVRLVDQKITEMADLKDPSPFTSTLFLHLQQIHLDLLAYVQTHDPQVLEQLKTAQIEFTTSIDGFHQLNPRLFPDGSRDKILQAYQPLQQALNTLLPISDAQSKQWSDLLQNNDRLIAHFENHLRPLIRPTQTMYLQRLDLVINLQNLVRTVPRHLTQYVLGLGAQDVQEKEIAQDDEKFERFLRMYERLANFEAERKTLLSIEGLWTENTDFAKRIMELEKSKSAAYTAMLNSSSALQTTISAVLPAVRPEVIDQKKTAILHSVMLLIVFSGAMVLVGLGSMIYSILWIYRHSRARSEEVPTTATPSSEKVAPGRLEEPRPSIAQEAWIRINLQGMIVRWKGDAPTLYGYESDEVMGKSIGMLFSSSEEIKKLYEGLKSDKQAAFDTSHVGKGQRPVPVHLQFSPVLDAAKKIQGIDLTVRELLTSAQDAA